MIAGSTVLAGWAPNTLEELQQEAAFLTLRDRKYLVPDDVVGKILAAYEGTLRVREIDECRIFGDETTYLDNAGYRSFHDALRKRPKRFMVRVRTYVDDGLCHLEAKVRDGRGNAVKHRLIRTPGGSLTVLAHAWRPRTPQPFVGRRYR
jgi:hypothetical protein